MSSGKYSIDRSKCKLCESEWGNYFTTVRQQELKFCCEVCALQFEKLVDRIVSTSSADIEDIKIDNTTKPRICRVFFIDKYSESYQINFNSEGDLILFTSIDES